MILLVAGTRPEIIKLAPVYAEMKKQRMDARWLFTGQHPEMGPETFAVFGMQPEYEYKPERIHGDLPELMALLANVMQDAIRDLQPDLILAVGDTLSCLAAIQQGFLGKTPTGHVEAGLRSWDLHSPFPEEAARIWVDDVADLKFAPTQRAALTLSGSRVWVTGNTEIDAIKMVKDAPLRDDRYIVVTTHRRENVEDLEKISTAIAELGNSGVVDGVVWPVHPGIAKIAMQHTKYVPNVEVVDPLPYDQMLNLVRHAKLLVTDSGGLQEMALGVGVPCLVLRQETERPEGIETGGARLVGTDTKKIVGWSAWLLQNEDEWNRMAGARNPYGDGKAAERIALICKAFIDGRTVSEAIGNWAGV